MELEAIDCVVASCDIEFKWTMIVPTGTIPSVKEIIDRLEEMLGIAGTEHLFGHISEKADIVHILLADDFGVSHSCDFEYYEPGDISMVVENEAPISPTTTMAHRFGMCLDMFNEKRRKKIEEEAH